MVQTGLFFSLLFLGYLYGGKHAARRELGMPFFKPKRCNFVWQYCGLMHRHTGSYNAEQFSKILMFEFRLPPKIIENHRGKTWKPKKNNRKTKENQGRTKTMITKTHQMNNYLESKKKRNNTEKTMKTTVTNGNPKKDQQKNNENQ